jgi:putative transposase
MPRKPRIHYFKAFYHVMLRGNHRQNIFFVDNDRAQFCQYLAEACQFYDCKIHLFCLMTNHVHLVIEVGHVPLAKIMQSITSRYARYINKQQQRRGYLCEGRYQAILVQNEKYLLELCYYIHMNPVKSGLVSHIDQFNWSSHHSYTLHKIIPWVTTEFIVQLLKKNTNVTKQHYLYFIQDREQHYKKPAFCKFGENGELIICDAINKNNQEANHYQRINLPLDIITTTICEQLQIAKEQLCSISTARQLVFARSMVTYFAHYRSGYTLTDIAIQLNRKADTLSKTTHNIFIKTQSNSKLLQLISKLEKKFMLLMLK